MGRLMVEALWTISQAEGVWDTVGGCEERAFCDCILLGQSGAGIKDIVGVRGENGGFGLICEGPTMGK